MNEAFIPILASLLTLLFTKIFDVFMARRKESLDKITLTLSAADEVADAAATTIRYLREELKEAREREVVYLQRIAQLEQALLRCEEAALTTKESKEI